MKKSITILTAAAALMLSASSCEMLVTEPIFAPASPVAYNGQTMVLTRVALVDYLWEDAKYCTFAPNPTVNGGGEEATVTFDISASTKESEEITIKAFNNEDPEHSSEQVVSVHKWELTVLDESGDFIEPTMPGSKQFLVTRGSKATVVMYDPVLGTAVENIVIRGIEKKDKPMYGELEWESSRMSSLATDYEPAATSASFVLTSSSTTLFVKATLGNVAYEISINPKN